MKSEPLIAQTQKIKVPDEILFAINELVRSSRPQDLHCPEMVRSGVWYGAGPRAGLSLISSCKAYAMIDRRDSVGWKYVRLLAKPAMRHRIRVTASANREQWDADRMIDELLDRVESRHKHLALAEEYKV